MSVYSISTWNKIISLSVDFIYKSNKVAKKEIQKNDQSRMASKLWRLNLTEEVKKCTEGRNFKRSQEDGKSTYVHGFAKLMSKFICYQNKSTDSEKYLLNLQ